MPLPLVDVIVPHLNDRDRLALCLDRLEAQDYPSDRYRVRVVDNGSDLPVDEIVARFPKASLAREPERGCGNARNRGVASTNGEILAFTDSDCQPQSDWLTKAVAVLAGGVEVIGGEIRIFYSDPELPTDEECFEKLFAFEQRRYVTRKNFAAGANIVVWRKIFDVVGPFRDGLLPEDLEWGRRAVAKGFRIGWAPDAVVWHPARRTWPELKIKVDRTMRHSRNYMLEMENFRLRWAIFTGALALPPMWKLWQVVSSPELVSLRQRWGAARMLFRTRYYRVGQMAGLLLQPAADDPALGAWPR